MREIHLNMRGIICGSYLTPQDDSLEGTLFDEPAQTDGLVKGIGTKDIWDNQW